MCPTPLDRHGSSARDLQERLAAERTGAPHLVYRDGEDRQQIVMLDGARERVLIGRSPSADVSLAWDARVSRLHAVLERTVDGWSVVDDGRALNGTFVNQERLRGRRRLGNRDLVEIGDTALVFCDLAEAPEHATIPADFPAIQPRLAITESQRRVLVALCRSFGEARSYPSPATNEEIARELHLSVDAVKTHLRTLFQKFGLESEGRAHKRVRLVERAFATHTLSELDYEAAGTEPPTRG